MKNIFRLFGVAVFIAVIVFSMISCGKNGQSNLFNGVGDNDEDDLFNGSWDRGDIVITFSGSTGVFTEIKSNSTVWYPHLNSGAIHLGDIKFKNITYQSDLKWTCEELTVYPGIPTITEWHNAILTISGNTLQVDTVDVNIPVTTYTRK